MSKIIKVIDEEMDHPLDYKILDSGRGNDIKRFVPEPGTNNLDSATPVDRDLLEQIQKNGVYEVETVHTVNSSSIDIYNCEIEGLDDFGIYKNIFIKMLVDMPNEFDQPKIKLNNIEYTMLYKPENEDFKPLDTRMLKAGQFYNLVFNGSQFIVENGSLPATPDGSGIISLNKIEELILNSYIQNLANPGYIKLSNGLMLQWFTGIANSSNGSSGTTITFPVAFDNNCLSLSANDVGIGAQSASAGLVNRFNCRIWSKEVTGGTYATGTVHVIAIGY
ncbi:hypothetical protein [Sebaldella sp. S0638]|uniref:gp53-like domain-containing protein n=1 Tax=Sebaldella sp. S0638 TaxID=2957809 RepID=UPI0020A0DB9D|nr:hypothetical protein [Sebaldella sp. S0638]MCP1224069.1 hypothetical protein [Sebaldella sp. S0638]